MLDAIWEFIYEYYVYPIMYDTGYNPFNTITWGILLVLSLFGVLKLLNKLDVEIDDSLIYSLIPFVFVGSSLRVIEDAGIASAPLKYLLITPLIYFLIALFVVIALIIGYFLEKREYLSKKKTVFLSGLIISIITSLILINYGVSHSTSSFTPIKVFSLAILVFTPTFFLLKFTPLKSIFDNYLYSTILGVHIFDASSTFVGYQLGATEKHVVPLFFIDLTGTAAVMYPLKIITVVFALYMIEWSFREEEKLKTIILLALVVLGLAPGLRNTLRLTLGV